jgi:hypothetical protein
MYKEDNMEYKYRVLENKGTKQFKVQRSKLGWFWRDYCKITGYTRELGFELTTVYFDNLKEARRNVVEQKEDAMFNKHNKQAGKKWVVVAEA